MTQLTERFFTRSVLPESSCLLQTKRNTPVTGRLRHASTFDSRAGLRHWGGSMPKSHGGPPLPSSPLPSPALPSPLPFPFLPSHPLPYLSLLSLRSGHLNTAMGPGERCKLPQWGLGRSPSRQTIRCIFESKRAALVAAILCVVLRKNICNFHYFLHKNN